MQKDRVSRSGTEALVVSAHLCEVLRLRAPKEADRNRTWFSVEATELRLRGGRKKADGNQFARVVFQAVARIEKSRRAVDEIVAARESRAYCEEPLQKVQFEAKNPFNRYSGQASLSRYMNRSGKEPPVTIRGRNPGEVVHGEILPFGLGRPTSASPKLLIGSRKLKALGTGGKTT